MNINRLFLFVALLVATVADGWAQTSLARQEIQDNLLRSGSNYLAYIDPTDELTPTPEGYEPFYLSHYGRHGSRWLIGKGQYADARAALERAHEAGVLTERGEFLLQQIKSIEATSEKRLGDLSSVGERQHHRIGKRFAAHFPEIFCRANTQVDARSTVVIRCILSMAAACEEIAAANPNAKIHNDVSVAFQYYLNADWSKSLQDDRKQRYADCTVNYDSLFIHPDRFYAQLFRDVNYRDSLETPCKLMKKVFTIASNQQSHDSDISLYDLFTNDECYDIWRSNNIDWYIRYAQGTAPFAQRELLKNVIATADTIVASRNFHGATLRYGHEVCLMPFAALLELGESGAKIATEEFATLDQTWADYRIFPMASNVQLVFYRPTEGDGDILVKALLNEREVTLTTAAVCGPYYRWTDLRDYYLQKIAAYEETLN